MRGYCIATVRGSECSINVGERCKSFSVLRQTQRGSLVMKYTATCTIVLVLLAVICQAEEGEKLTTIARCRILNRSPKNKCKTEKLSDHKFSSSHRYIRKGDGLMSNDGIGNSKPTQSEGYITSDIVSGLKVAGLEDHNIKNQDIYVVSGYNLNHQQGSQNKDVDIKTEDLPPNSGKILRAGSTSEDVSNSQNDLADLVRQTENNNKVRLQQFLKDHNLQRDHTSLEESSGSGPSAFEGPVLTNIKDDSEKSNPEQVNVKYSSTHVNRVPSKQKYSSQYSNDLFTNKHVGPIKVLDNSPDPHISSGHESSSHIGVNMYGDIGSYKVNVLHNLKPSKLPGHGNEEQVSELQEQQNPVYLRLEHQGLNPSKLSQGNNILQENSQYNEHQFTRLSKLQNSDDNHQNFNLNNDHVTLNDEENVLSRPSEDKEPNKDQVKYTMYKNLPKEMQIFIEKYQTSIHTNFKGKEIHTNQDKGPINMQSFIENKAPSPDKVSGQNEEEQSYSVNGPSTFGQIEHGKENDHQYEQKYLRINANGGQSYSYHSDHGGYGIQHGNLESFGTSMQSDGITQTQRLQSQSGPLYGQLENLHSQQANSHGQTDYSNTQFGPSLSQIGHLNTHIEQSNSQVGLPYSQRAHPLSQNEHYYANQIGHIHNQLGHLNSQVDNAHNKFGRSFSNMELHANANKGGIHETILTPDPEHQILNPISETNDLKYSKNSQIGHSQEQLLGQIGKKTMKDDSNVNEKLISRLSEDQNMKLLKSMLTSQGEGAIIDLSGYGRGQSYVRGRKNYFNGEHFVSGNQVLRHYANRGYGKSHNSASLRNNAHIFKNNGRDIQSQDLSDYNRQIRYENQEIQNFYPSNDYTKSAKHIKERSVKVVKVPYKVKVPVVKHIHYPVHIKVTKPYPVPYPVYKEIHIPKPVPVYITKKIPVHVSKPYPVHVPKEVKIEVPHYTPVKTYKIVKVPEPKPVFITKPMYIKLSNHNGFAQNVKETE